MSEQVENNDNNDNKIEKKPAPLWAKGAGPTRKGWGLSLCILSCAVVVLALVMYTTSVNEDGKAFFDPVTNKIQFTSWFVALGFVFFQFWWYFGRQYHPADDADYLVGKWFAAKLKKTFTKQENLDILVHNLLFFPAVLLGGALGILGAHLLQFVVTSDLPMTYMLMPLLISSSVFGYIKFRTSLTVISQFGLIVAVVGHMMLVFPKFSAIFIDGLKSFVVG